MKNITLKLIFILIPLLAAGITLSGQGVPQGFNYMAIARDENGDILPGLEMTVRIAILDGDLTKVWEEDHEVITNETGLFQIIVGEGTSTGYGYAPSFDEINWKMQPLYISTSVNPAGEFIEMGTAQLFSVPYAMVSNLAYGGVDNPFMMNGDTVEINKSVDVIGNYPLVEEEALFEVKRQDGQTMFAVYNQGVRINVPLDDAIKGAKGGFAVGGFSGYKGITQDLFTLNKDSARIYIDQTPDLLKGAKGGFSVGGFAYGGKEPIQDYLFIAPDSARIYVEDSGKAAKGGFSVGGFGAKKIGSTNFLDITPENYFIGHESGSKIPETSGGQYNSVIGYQAGKNLTTGGYNTMLGYNAGLNASSGNNNILIGNFAGNNLTTGIHNTLIGNSAGYSHTDQEFNVLIGTSAGSHINSPWWEGSFNTYVGINSGYQMRYSKENVFLGTNAGYWLDNGKGNTFVGIDAGRSQDESGEPWAWRSGVRADFNTIIGDKAGYYVTNAYNNVIIGNQAGYNIGDGDRNVFIGNEAGFSESGSDKLYIDNSNTSTPLIYGDFAANTLMFNGNVGVSKAPAYTLDVGGDININTGSKYKIGGTNLAASDVGAEPVLTKGDLTATSPISISATRQIIGGSAAISIANASTSTKGAVQLSNSYSGTSQTLATTEKALTDGLATRAVGPGMTVGAIHGTTDENILFVGEIALIWNPSLGSINIWNQSESVTCWYWYSEQKKGEAPTGNAMKVNPTESIVIPVTDGAGYEIHFGDAEGTAGYGSVWLQVVGSTVTGHYIKN